MGGMLSSRMHLEFSFTPLSRKPRFSLQQGKDSSLKFLNKFLEPSTEVKAKQTTVRNSPPNPGHTDADRWLRSFQIRQTPELILSIRDTTRLLRQENYTLVKMMIIFTADDEVPTLEQSMHPSFLPERSASHKRFASEVFRMLYSLPHKDCGSLSSYSSPSRIHIPSRHFERRHSQSANNIYLSSH